MAEPSTPKQRATVWRLETEILWLVLLVVVAHFVRLDALPLRGEEPRRAHLGTEMLRTGDWIVPRFQGEPVFFRPPLQNWLIGLLTWVHGECDNWAVRLPSALATLLAVLLVYGYARTFLTRLGAFASGAAFATMAEVLQLGALAETEALFSLFVSGSLLIWHWGYARGWPPRLLWIASYAVVALGMLTKGPQAPVYFVATVTVYLLLRRQWRLLLTPAHLLGIVTFLVIAGAWLVPYYLRMGPAATWNVVCGEAGERFHEVDAKLWATHLALYPLEILACLLPWSVLFLFYTRRAFRDTVGTARPMVVFLCTCLAVTFPTCWLVPEARTRYYLPLYPCFGPLLGLVVDRCAVAIAGSPLRTWWALFVKGVCVVLAGLPFLVLAGGELERLTGLPLYQPPLPAAGLALTLVALLVLLYREGTNFDPRRIRFAILALAGCLALAYSVWVLNLNIRASVSTREAVTQVRQQIGDRTLVSFGHTHHLFAHYYQKHIPQQPWPRQSADFPDNVDYFCFEVLAKDQTLPFAWEKLAEINCDRTPRPDPSMRVVIGRRLRQEPTKR